MTKKTMKNKCKYTPRREAKKGRMRRMIQANVERLAGVYRAASCWQGVVKGSCACVLAGLVLVVSAYAKNEVGEPGVGKVWETRLPGNVILELVRIGPGKFLMGSPESEDGRSGNEGPQTEVRLTRGFWLGRYEVTQRQWEAVMGNNPSIYKNALFDVPVEGVWWAEAMEFCRRLTERERAAGRLPEGYAYTLPTEAQWEYACRAGTTTAFHYGDRLDASMANFDGTSPYGGANQGVFRRKTVPVGSYAPNAWGLYDMHGNVWEWCLNQYGDKLMGDFVSDPQGESSGSIRVVRGGAFFTEAADCRAASRIDVDYKDSDIRNAIDVGSAMFGFRVALSPVPATNTNNLTTGTEWVAALPGNVSLELVRIGPGKFLMGSPESEDGRSGNEGPQTEVRLTRGFWLGRYEVTQRQWEAVMGNNPSEFRNAVVDTPVEGISWEEAMEFCRKLTETERAAGRLPEGYEYTLPTEAQWEYACRAGTTTAFHYGDRLGASMANFDATSPYGVADKSVSRITTVRVGLSLPNDWGLYDMHGNVFEWCLDWYTFELSGGSVFDPQGPSSGSRRVIRGGGWSHRRSDSRSASRFNLEPGAANNNLGFRVALISVR